MNLFTQLCGIHPNEISMSKKEIDAEIGKIEVLAQYEKNVAIGEIGLDYHWVQDTRNCKDMHF